MANNTDFGLTNYEVLTEKTASLFYNESEKRLLETINTFNIWSDKAFKLLSLLLPSFVLLTGYLFSTPFHWHKVPAIVFLIVNVYSLYNIVKAISAHTLQHTGTRPSLLFIQDLLISDENNSQYIGWVVNLCENMEDKIDHNNTVNEIRVIYINRAIKVSGLIAPLIAASVAILVSFSHPH